MITMTNQTNELFTTTLDAWKKQTEEYLAQLKTCQDDLTKLEGEALETAKTAIKDGAELLAQSLTYTAALQTAWRAQASRGVDTLVDAWKKSDI